MRAVIAAMGVGLVALASTSSCEWQSQSECHRDLVERFGCCPTCDSECRAAIDEACAEIHDTPLEDGENPEASSGSSDSADASGDPRPPHVQPT